MRAAMGGGAPGKGESMIFTPSRPLLFHLSILRSPRASAEICEICGRKRVLPFTHASQELGAPGEGGDGKESGRSIPIPTPTPRGREPGCRSGLHAHPEPRAPASGSVPVGTDVQPLPTRIRGGPHETAATASRPRAHLRWRERPREPLPAALHIARRPVAADDHPRVPGSSPPLRPAPGIPSVSSWLRVRPIRNQP